MVESNGGRGGGRGGGKGEGELGKEGKNARRRTPLKRGRVLKKRGGFLRRGEAS